MQECRSPGCPTLRGWLLAYEPAWLLGLLGLSRLGLVPSISHGSGASWALLWPWVFLVGASVVAAHPCIGLVAPLLLGASMWPPPGARGARLLVLVLGQGLVVLWALSAILVHWPRLCVEGVEERWRLVLRGVALVLAMAVGVFAAALAGVMLVGPVG